MDPISLIPQLDPAVAAAVDPAPQAPSTPKTTPPPASAPQAVPSETQLTQAAAMIEDSLADHNLRLHFSVDTNNNNRIVVQVIDDTKGKVIRTIPPEDLFKNVMSGSSIGIGLLVDQTG